MLTKIGVNYLVGFDSLNFFVLDKVKYIWYYFNVDCFSRVNGPETVELGISEIM